MLRIDELLCTMPIAIFCSVGKTTEQKQYQDF